MDKGKSDDMKPMAEQLTYADILFKGAWSGIFLLLVTYGIYLSGILTPQVEIPVVIANWDKGVNEYLHITHSPHGWGWTAMIGKGDFLNYVGLALLALLTIVCYGVLTAGYYKRKDWPYAIIAVLEILVLSVAASGILGSGGH